MIAIIALFISLAVAIVTALQWRVADNKLRLNLFERRYKVYEATRTLVRKSVQESAQVSFHVALFDVQTSNAKFLFDADVVNYLQQIRKLALDEDLLTLSDRSKSAEITNVFAPYLQFTNIKSRFIPSFMSKKRAAKEWLYFLACALIGLLVLPILLFILALFVSPARHGTLAELFGILYSGLFSSNRNDKLISWLFVVGPYLLCQLIRSVIWALKAVRSS
jgi:hypothetical protein